MIFFLLLFLQNLNDPELVSLGEKVFSKSCAVGYCHGVGGTAGKGPRLKGRSFQAEYVYRVTRDGIPDSAMPSWNDRLSEREIWAVVGYILSLSDLTEKPTDVSEIPSEATAEKAFFDSSPPPTLKGKALFFDATKKNTRCSTCHAMEGRGIGIGPNLKETAKINLSMDRIQASHSQHTLIVNLQDGESFLALRSEETPEFIRLYDLTLPPPVLRSFKQEEILSLRPTNKWSHKSMLANYTSQELTEIIEYLLWVRFSQKKAVPESVQ